MSRQLKQPCDDCGIDLGAIDEYAYMLWTRLWPRGAKFLCVGCLETRLGRVLEIGDFNLSLPINSGLAFELKGAPGQPDLILRFRRSERLLNWLGVGA